MESADRSAPASSESVDDVPMNFGGAFGCWFRTRKLVESCAKLAQGSARTAEMVKLEEPQDEYGYPPADSANRLNPQQVGKGR